ncbi:MULTISPECIES: murein hydrolase activator EnvC family protein [Carboxydothermus]|uniref:M23/M37 peptidase domain protein n=2 Tax=Carboxydothermus TaxID=129957 RepID=Q3AF61_CARHZ|nr:MULTISPECIES: M23 family metallopeptidase [Carboxydothermus]ABB15715.1 M23/M37 peptidase domain protein [Carboxydothermus hydrogenoformans Z-2901]NYE57250.1 murein DD-endopeptidase MepM/ murein hydrolase activator NlpD [Carboxydothermus ferrireducens DSM 11255]
MSDKDNLKIYGDWSKPYIRKKSIYRPPGKKREFKFFYKFLLVVVIVAGFTFWVSKDLPGASKLKEAVKYVLTTETEVQPVFDRVLEIGMGNEEALTASNLEIPVDGKVIRGFGLDSDGFFHGGLDILGEPNKPVKAAAHGTVVKTGYKKGYDNYLIISWGEQEVLYANLKEVWVKAGELVEKGQEIGCTGNSGMLHVEFHDKGLAVDPAPVFKVKS